jgi:hypothetical protein
MVSEAAEKPDPLLIHFNAIELRMGSAKRRSTEAESG